LRENGTTVVIAAYSSSNANVVRNVLVLVGRRSSCDCEVPWQFESPAFAVHKKSWIDSCRTKAWSWQSRYWSHWGQSLPLCGDTKNSWVARGSYFWAYLRRSMIVFEKSCAAPRLSRKKIRLSELVAAKKRVSVDLTVHSLCFQFRRSSTGSRHALGVCWVG